MLARERALIWKLAMGIEVWYKFKMSDVNSEEYSKRDESLSMMMMSGWWGWEQKKVVTMKKGGKLIIHSETDTQVRRHRDEEAEELDEEGVSPKGVNNRRGGPTMQN
jgi:hypothetical protein